MTPTTAQPLPECEACGTPTRREAHRANGGLCTPCRNAYGAALASAQARRAAR